MQGIPKSSTPDEGACSSRFTVVADIAPRNQAPSIEFPLSDLTTFFRAVFFGVFALPPSPPSKAGTMGLLALPM
jgi:hypothetical protein